MDDSLQRRSVLAAAGASALGVTAGCLGGSGSVDDGGSDGDWRTASLTDVRTGETFTVEELTADGPVLLETFAVWCSTCLRQQKELRAYHAGDDAATSVTLNVDPNEDAEKVRRHLEEHGFDWRYAVAPSAVTRSLIDQFGQSIAHPPSAPVVLVCQDGSRRLPDGVKQASDLRSQVSDGC